MRREKKNGGEFLILMLLRCALNPPHTPQRPNPKALQGLLQEAKRKPTVLSGCVQPQHNSPLCCGVTSSNTGSGNMWWKVFARCGDDTSMSPHDAHRCGTSGTFARHCGHVYPRVAMAMCPSLWRLLPPEGRGFGGDPQRQRGKIEVRDREPDRQTGRHRHRHTLTRTLAQSEYHVVVGFDKSLDKR